MPNLKKEYGNSFKVFKVHGNRAEINFVDAICGFNLEERVSPKTRTQINKMQNMHILNNKYTLQISHWLELVAT
jgi:hypothetical protein